jgi:AbrB family looped-hinge helix DNA binding protein
MRASLINRQPQLGTMSESPTKEESNPKEREDTVTVSVSSNGQATIPKKFREKLGIDAPGQVTFRETEAGEIVLERIPTAEEMKGFAARTGEATTETPASELLHEKREEEKQERSSK